MSKGNTFENELLLLIFNATTIPQIASNTTSSALAVLWTALHTADPGEAGVQTTSESTYTSYARTSVARTSVGWTVSGNVASPTSAITFPAGTGASGTVTHFSVGSSSSGAGEVYYSGTVTPNIVTGNGITPSLTTGSSITED